ncbi:hypothetical protein LTR09_011741 [Extremus antarcticus]|uniref:Uncharacterized protein n=1 Tax=Extremus antarcticus TaxID=702011 RepID=A0AAJ0D5Q3_9PEZI|nr:hypothetical protein LTR09_011741 [Extremus antarcticus]
MPHPDTSKKPAFDANQYKLNNKALCDYSVYPSSDKRSHDDVAQAIARQVVMGFKVPDVELIIHLRPSVRDIRAAFAATSDKIVHVFFDVYMKAPEPLSVQAYELWKKWKGLTMFSAALGEEYSESAKTYCQCMQDAAQAHKWEKDLRYGVIPKPRKDDKYAASLVEKHERRIFAEEKYSIDIDNPGLGSAKSIVNAVIHNSLRAPSLELLQDIKPDTKDVTNALILAMYTMDQAWFKVVTDKILEPPDWISSRLLQFTIYWDTCTISVSGTTKAYKAAETGEELELLSACIRDLAECLSYKRASEHGVWPAQPSKRRTNGKLSTGDKTDSIARFGPHNEEWDRRAREAGPADIKDVDDMMEELGLGSSTRP